MAHLPTVRNGFTGADRWSLRARADVGQVRLAWRDPGGSGRPIEVHGTTVCSAASGWTPSDRTLLAVAGGGRFLHAGLGPLSTAWSYAVTPVGARHGCDGASVSVTTPTSVTITGVPIATVGAFDGSGLELALAPSGFVRYRATFPHDVDFRHGLDEPGRRWSYLQPGPDDAWAGRRGHRFRLRFDLSRLPDDDLDLAVWLVDRHPTRAGAASVVVNGHPDESLLFDAPAGAGDIADLVVPGHGAGPVQLERPLSRALLTVGENTLDIVKDEGSWIAYDALGVFGRHGDRAVPDLA